MSECVDYEEYKAKFQANQRITGFGLDTTMHVPCPFCAEAEFIVHTVLEVQAAYSRGAVCSHCGRGARGFFNPTVYGVSFELVQTRGVTAPAWLVPPMRRVE